MVVQGSLLSEIREAISYGVIKMNIDTDTQWAMWDGVRAYEAKYHDYLQGTKSETQKVKINLTKTITTQENFKSWSRNNDY